jgi:hypothetical protein
MKQTGQNLIFLISQPRAGSTLTQRILGVHSLIHTQSEPWVLLHPLHALKPENLYSNFNSECYAKGLNDFIESIPGGKIRYQEAMAETFGSFYEAILEQKGKRFFLDKTPRYYNILDELGEYYPDAKFILLWRNPAAVLTSIISTWIKDNWYILSNYREDILSAPSLMLQGKRKLGNRAISIKYEDLVTNPGDHIRSLCSFLGIPYEDGMKQYGKGEKECWRFGDHGNAFDKENPDPAFIDNWQTKLDNPQLWRLVSDYINYLDENTISGMGYSYEQIMNCLLEHKPDMDIQNHSRSLNQLIDNTRFEIIENRRLQRLNLQKDLLLKQLNEKYIKQDSAMLKMENHIKHLQNSYSFRLGRFILLPAILLLDAIRNIK